MGWRGVVGCFSFLSLFLFLSLPPLPLSLTRSLSLSLSLLSRSLFESVIIFWLFSSVSVSLSPSQCLTAGRQTSEEAAATLCLLEEPSRVRGKYLKSESLALLRHPLPA